MPTVAKTLTGSQGAGVSILETPLTANTTMQTYYKLEADVHLQEYLEAKGRDIRAIVIDNKVVVAMERTANKGDFRANLGAGGSGQKINLTDSEEDMAIKAAQAVGLGFFAGVDLVRTNNNTTYCIEVNGNPGSKIIEITGVNYFEALIDMVEKYTGNKQTSTRSARPEDFGLRSNSFLPERKYSIPITVELNNGLVLNKLKHLNDNTTDKFRDQFSPSLSKFDKLGYFLSTQDKNLSFVKSFL